MAEVDKRRYYTRGKYDASADGVLNDKFVLPADTAGNESTDQFDASEKTSTNDIDQMMEKRHLEVSGNRGCADKICRITDSML